jgi:ABC-type protease/lipase transport system fused ATPase/permease subunit
MTPDQVISHFGRQRDVVLALGITRQAVSNWKKRGKIPLEAQLALQEITRGKLKMVTRIARHK